MTEEPKETNKIIVLCPHCKTNQEGEVGAQNKCINGKCGEAFTSEEAVPVIVHAKE